MAVSSTEHLSQLQWSKYPDGLMPVVTTDAITGQLLMQAYANELALKKTLDTGQAHYYSRSRQALWHKGETSGHFQTIEQVRTDCDADCLQYICVQQGPACHTGEQSCFFQIIQGRTLSKDDKIVSGALSSLEAELDKRMVQHRSSLQAEPSYTRSLFQAGSKKIQAKIMEEAAELCAEMHDEQDLVKPERVVSEAADLIYHVMVALKYQGLSLQDVQAELHRRFGVSGIEEKLSRNIDKPSH